LIAALATRQGGVASRRQLLALGVGSAAIGRRVGTGRLLRVHRGVYAVGHAALGWRGRATAALLAVGRDAVVSHRSAAAAWGLLPEREGPIAVTVCGRGPRTRPGIAVHRSSLLDPRDVRRIDGVPVTAPGRTIVDLARAGEPALDRALAEAQVLRLLRRPDLEAAIQRAPGRRGVAALRRALAGGGDAPTRSELERAMLRLVAEADLPPPAVNARLGGYTVDFLWERERVVVETDGWAAHGHRRAFEADRARDADLQAGGYRVVRFTWRQITGSPLLVATRIARVLATGP
jgi:very-short-patch-repair endonuclease